MMKIELSSEEAKRHYWRKGFSTREVNDAGVESSEKRYVLSIDWSSRKMSYDKYHSTLGKEETEIKLSIPAIADRAPGGGFVDPLRMMPISRPYDERNDEYRAAFFN